MSCIYKYKGKNYTKDEFYSLVRNTMVQPRTVQKYEKVLFPTGNTASKIEGHTTLEEFKKQKEDRIKELEESKTKEKYNFTDDYGQVHTVKTDLEKINREINQLKQELERLETEGFGALRPIFNFYENTVTNILKKQGYNPVLVTDEYGNTWNEVAPEMGIISLSPEDSREYLPKNYLIDPKNFDGYKQNTVVNLMMASVLNWVQQDRTISVYQAFDRLKTAYSKLAEHPSYKDKFQPILNNFNSFKSLTLDRLEQLEFLDIAKKFNDRERFANDTDTAPDERYDQDAMSIDPKDSVSGRLRMFLSFVKSDKPSYLGEQFPEYMQYDDVMNTAHTILNGVPGSYQEMINALRNQTTRFPWINSLIEKLESPNTSELVRNEFVMAMRKQYAKHYMVNWSEWRVNGKEGFTVNVISSDQSGIATVIYDSWYDNLANSSMVHLLDGAFVLDAAKRKAFVDRMPNVRGEAIKGNMEPLNNWLQEIGIKLSPAALEALKNPGKARVFKDLKTTASLFDSKNGVFYNIVQRLSAGEKAGEDSLALNNPYINNSGMMQLASLEAQYRTNIFSNSFRNANNDQVYSYAMPSFLSDRVEMLMNNDVELENLSNDVFAKNSTFLAQLKNKESFLRRHFNVSYADGIVKTHSNADGVKIENMSPTEYMIYALGLHANSALGEPGAGRKIGHYLLPTFSDKKRKAIITTAKHDTKIIFNSFKKEITGFGPETKAAIENIVDSEINRMLAFKGHPDPAYSTGYKYFYLLPSLNNIEAVFDSDHVYIDSPENRTILYQEALSYVKQLILRRYSQFKNAGIIEEVEGQRYDPKTKSNINGTHDILNYVDSRYLKDIVDMNINSINQQGLYVAADYVINNLIVNTNMYQLVFGDPAMYFKGDKKDTSIDAQINSTYDNIGKRLAMMIAPGHSIAESDSDTIKYAFFKDDEDVSKNYTEIERILKAHNLDPKPYTEIEGTDAQEYTTLKEHLHVLNLMGRISKSQMEGILSRSSSETLTDEDLHVIFQPIKPVYSNVMFESDTNTSRVLYVKSSSFPLFKQLTKGHSIDNLREAMEQEGVDRVAYKTAVKVGSRSLVSAFDSNHDFKSVDELRSELSSKQQPYVSRKGFRIQQEVPYDPSKAEATKGTQETKLLFLDILDLDGFQYNGKEYSAKDLKAIYEDLHKTLYGLKSEKFYKRFYTKQGKLDIKQLKEMMVDEARSRGMSKYDIDSLETYIDTNNEEAFLMPLHSHPLADKFESLLLSLIDKQIIKQKMPGKSYVLGSELGFRLIETSSNPSASYPGIVYVPGYDPSKGLRSQTEDGKPAQVIAPFKFRNRNGELEDVRKYVVDGKLDTNKIPKELLQIFGFRIPTQGHNSMSYIEIVGFLPPNAGDLLIAPKDFTKQMGSDFDIDKLFSYVYNTRAIIDEEALSTLLSTFKDTKKAVFSAMLPETKKAFETLLEARREAISAKDISRLQEVDESLSELIYSSPALASLRDEIEAVKSNILRWERDDSTEIKATQNAILDIHFSVLKNKGVFPNIMSPLGFGDTDSLAREIVALRKERRSKGTNPAIANFRPSLISEEYYQDKYFNGIVGKAMTGIKSLDSTFNAAIQGKGMYFRTYTEDGVEMPDGISFEGQSLYDLSGVTSLDGKNKSYHIAGYQSAAVDNEKEQILGKLNSNPITAAAERAIAQVGWPAEYSALLTSQDIILEFVDVSRRLSDSTSSVAGDRKELAIMEITERWLKKLGDPNYIADKDTPVSRDEMREMIKNGGKQYPNYFKHQLDLFAKFIDATTKGEALGDIQRAINTDSAGLGKNFIEVISKAESVKSSVMYNRVVANSVNVLGKPITDEDGRVVGIDFNTINGYATQYGLLPASTIFNNLFPYNSSAVRRVYKELANTLGYTQRGKAISDKVKKDVWNASKSFIFSDESVWGGDPNELRNNLLFSTGTVDQNGNRTITSKSLAVRVKEYSETVKGSKNIFLSKLSYDITPDLTTPDFIKYAATKGENYDETNTYQGLIDLLIDPESKELAADLIKYSYLTGGIQQAINFVRYIPTSYLEHVGLAGLVREVDYKSTDLFGDVPSLTMGSSRFVTQFIQHNPAMAPKITNKDIKEGIFASRFEERNGLPDIFTLPPIGNNIAAKLVMTYSTPEGSVQSYPKFIAIPDKTSNTKFRLYTLVPTKDAGSAYFAIDTLGGKYKITEYSNKELIGNSTIEANTAPYTDSVKANIGSRMVKAVVTNTEDSSYKSKFELFSLKEGDSFDIVDTLNTIKNISTNPYHVELATVYSKLLPLVNNTLKGIIENKAQRAGSYYHPGNTTGHSNVLAITNNRDISQRIFEKVFLHELSHALTVDILDRVLERKVEGITDEQIKAANRLVKLHNHLIEGIEDGKYEEYGLNKDIFKKFKETNQRRKNNKASDADLEFLKANKRYYSFINIYELIAEGMSNSETRTLLSSIPYSDGNFVSKIIDLIKRILKSINIQTGTAYAEAVDSIFSLMGVTETNEAKEPRMPIESKPKVGVRSYYEGDIIPDSNTIFVFGSNPQGRHGAGAAKVAVQKFGAIYGQGEGLQGNAYALPTKDLTVKENNSLKSIDEKAIIESIKKLYRVAEQNPTKQFKIAYRNTDKSSLNGYTGLEMIQMFKAAGNIPSNIIFSKEWVDTDLFNEGKDGEVYLKEGIKANAEQVEALNKLNNFIRDEGSTMMTLSGYAGTGKTTLMGYFLNQLDPSSIRVTATTHKAVSVIGKATGLEAGTIHSLIGLKPSTAAKDFSFDNIVFGLEGSSKKIRELVRNGVRLIVIDEASMVDDTMFSQIKEFIAKTDGQIKVIFIGDSAQLPPVVNDTDELKSPSKISKVFTDLPTANLTTVERTANGNPLLGLFTDLRENLKSTNPHDYKSRITPDGRGYAYLNSYSAFYKQAVALYATARQLEDMDYVKVIAYSNAAVLKHNQAIRQMLYGNAPQLPLFSPGDFLLTYEALGDSEDLLPNSSDLTVVKVEKAVDDLGFRVYKVDVGDTVLSILDHEDSESVDKYKERYLELEKDYNYAKQSGNESATRVAFERFTAFRNSVIIATDIPIETITLRNGKTFDRKASKQIDYGYAITSHKAQGSTYKHVLIDEANIDGVASLRAQKGLGPEATNKSKYVAFSRASTAAYVYAGSRGDTKNYYEGERSDFFLDEIDLETETSTESAFVDPIIKQYQLRRQNILNAISKARTNKDIKRVAQLDKELKQLSKAITDLKTIELVDTALLQAEDELKAVGKALSTELSYSELNNLADIIYLWKDLREHLQDYMNFKKDSPLYKTISERIDNIEKEAFSLAKIHMKMAKQVINKAVRSASTREVGNVTDPKEDIGYWRGNFLDISRSQDPLLQAVDKICTQVAYDQTDEYREFQAELEDVFKDFYKSRYYQDGKFTKFLQVDDKGNKTGRLVSPYSHDYYKLYGHYKGRVIADPSDIKAYANYMRFLRKNVIMFDVRALFYSMYKAHGGTEAFTADDIKAREDYLKAVLGETRYNIELERQRERLSKWEMDLAGYKLSIEDSEELSDLEKNAAIESFIRLRSPFEFMKVYMDPSLDVSVKESITGDRYLIGIPRKTVNGKETGFYDSSYLEIERDPILLHTYESIVTLMNRYVGYLPEHLTYDIRPNFLPILTKSESGVLHGTLDNYATYGMKAVPAGLRDAWVDAITQNIGGDYTRNTIDPVTGKERPDFTFNFLSKNPDLDPLPEDRSYDIPMLIDKFAKQAIFYKHRSRVQDMLYLANTVSSELKESTITPKGNPMINWITRKLHVTTGLDNNRQALEYYISAFHGNKREIEGATKKKMLTAADKRKQMALIAELELVEERLARHSTVGLMKRKAQLEKAIDEIGKNFTWGRLGDTILQYSQIRGMGWNPVSAANNITWGLLSNLIHAAGEQDYTMTTFRKAYAKMLNVVTPGKLRELGPEMFKEATKLHNLVYQFDVIKEINEAEYSSMVDNSRVLKGISKEFNPFEMHRKGEYLNQGVNLIAILMTEKITDVKGNERSFYDAFNTDGSWNTEEFGERPTERINALRMKTDQLNKRIHGNYDPNSPLRFKRMFIGRAIMQFRSWIPEAYQTRFEATNYDERLGREVKGRYRSFGAYFDSSTPYYKSIGKATGALAVEMANIATLRKITALNKYGAETAGESIDVANMRMNAMDGLILSALLIAFKILKSMWDADDDDKKKNKIMLAMNIINRLENDAMFFYNPLAIESIVQSTIPATKLLVDVSKLLDALYDDIVLDEDYILTGPAAGKAKVPYRVGKLVPGIAGYLRYEGSQEKMDN